MDESSLMPIEPVSISVHIVDARGVYLRTMQVDPMEPQPAGAIYGELPELQPGHVLVAVGGEWRQVPEAQLPPLPVPQPAAPEVPESVLRWQAVRALRLHSDPNDPGQSCLATVHALRDAAPELQRADIDDALQNVLTWRRQSPTLQQIAEAAQWPPEFVDELFIAAGGYDL